MSTVSITIRDKYEMFLNAISYLALKLKNHAQKYNNNLDNPGKVFKLDACYSFSRKPK